MHAALLRQLCYLTKCIPTNAKARKPQRTRLWNPFQDGPALEAESKPIFRFRSYHRTGAESYYAGKATCKGWNKVFFTVFLQRRDRSSFALASKIRAERRS